ncbi:MAG: restriction endonuclease subunit S [Clostridiales bacterium]|nr:restriction endonuclease subunit S [Clostridiales bacterium]
MLCKIGDAFSLIRNGANIKQGMDDTGYPITRIETISNRVVDRRKMGYAGIHDLTRYEDYVLQDGDILMSHINSEAHLGKVAIFERRPGETIIHGMNLLCLRSKNDIINSRYAYYFLSSDRFLRQIPRITKKSVNQASFNVAALKNLDIIIAPMERQLKVVTILDKISVLIELRNTQLKELDELVKARFVEMFGDLKINPMGWPVEEFPDFAIIDCNMTTDYEKYADYPHIGIDSIEKGTGELRGYRTVKEDGVISGKYIFTPQHIIYSKIRPNLNKVALPNFGGLCSADAYPILPKQDKCNRVFLAIAMRSEFFLEYILQFSSRTNLPKVNRKAIAGFRMPLPPLELQTQFAAFVHSTDQTKSTIRASLDELETLKKSLMQQYFG